MSKAVLRRLIKRVEAATGTDRQLEAEMALAIGQYDHLVGVRKGDRIVRVEAWQRRAGDESDRFAAVFAEVPGSQAPGWEHLARVPPFMSSLDAALQIVPAGWGWMTGCAPGEAFFASAQTIDRPNGLHAAAEAEATSAALAVCLVGLRARLAEEAMGHE